MIIGIAMVRDEDDILGHVLCQLFAQGVDHVIVADNLSTDGTRSQLERLAKAFPITIVDDPEPGFYQSYKMSELAHRAADMGADWVLPFDADEWWYGIDGTIAEALAGTDADIVEARGYDHLPREGDPHEANPIRRMGWRRRATQKFPKVAFRAAKPVYVHMGNHNVERAGTRAQGLLEFRHYQYRSLPQLIRKVRQGAAAYEASTVDKRHGTHWKELAARSDEELALEWKRLCHEGDLVYDPAPMP